MTGLDAGTPVDIPRIKLPMYSSKDTFYRSQYPVYLAFALTIHKAQGQTFDKVGVDLSGDMLTHGQMYVAFSRVTKFSDLKVYHEKYDLTENMCRNVVDKNLLDFDSDLDDSDSDVESNSSSPTKRIKIGDDD